MLARGWWPVQDWGRRHPVIFLGTALAVPVLTALPGVVSGIPGWMPWLTAGLWLAMLGCRRLPGVVGDAGMWAALVMAVIAGWLAAKLSGAASSGYAASASHAASAGHVAIAASLALLPWYVRGSVLGALWDQRRTAAQATGVSLLAAQIAGIPLWFCDGFGAVAGLLTATVAAALWAPAAWGVQTDPPAPPRPLAPLKKPPFSTAWFAAAIVCGLGLVALGSLGDPLRRDPALWGPPLVIALLWSAASGRIAVGVIAGGGGIIAATAMLNETALADPAVQRQLAANIALAQLPALLWWSERHRAETAHTGMILAAWLTVVIAGSGSGQPAVGVLGGALIAVIASLIAFIAVSSGDAPTVIIVSSPVTTPESGSAPNGAAVVSAVWAWADTLDPGWRWYTRGKLLADPLYARLAADPRRWGRVLDLGCGNGLILAIATARGDADELLGIDLNADKLVAARRLLTAAARPIATGTALLRAELPLAHDLPARFDTVVLADVLHYWPAELQLRILCQARAALAEGGVLMLRDGVSDSGRVALGERFTTAIGLNPATGTLQFPSEAELRQRLHDAGFTTINLEPCGGDNRLVIASG